jgi:CDP-diacylglycerol pyrophosphatase
MKPTLSSDRARRGLAVILLSVLVVLRPWPARAAHPNALWRVVHDLCVTDKTLFGLPAPCLSVDLTRGVAVVKDAGHATQLLLVPTAKVTGIESSSLLAPDSPNYWRAAWETRRTFEGEVGHPVPRDVIGLVVNSRVGRTQDQLHIHIDCVRADVRQALRAHGREIGDTWSDLGFDLAGQRYRARRLEGADLGTRDPFKLLAEDPEARADMGRETLAVVGMSFEGGAPGFVLLSDRADLPRGDRGAGEDLLDHGCGVLKSPG